MTDIYSELCQETLFEPDPKVVERQVAELNSKAKNRGVSTRRRQSEQSASEEENSAEEEARDRAKTFLMSLGQKRAFEMQKKQEKEFNARFKVIFVNVVSCHMIMEARTMKVIDMTNTEKLTSKNSPKKRSSSKKSKVRHGKSPFREVKVQQLDLDLIADERAVIPKSLMAFHKHMIIRTQRLNEFKRRQELRDEMLKVANNASISQQMEEVSKSNNLSLMKPNNRRHTDENDQSESGGGSKLGLFVNTNNAIMVKQNQSRKHSNQSIKQKQSSKLLIAKR